MNKLIIELMEKEDISRKEAIEMVIDEYQDTGNDPDETLYNLGFELDFSFDLYDIVSRKK
jgi:hypothetical protein